MIKRARFSMSFRYFHSVFLYQGCKDCSSFDRFLVFFCISIYPSHIELASDAELNVFFAIAAGDDRKIS